MNRDIFHTFSPSAILNFSFLIPLPSSHRTLPPRQLYFVMVAIMAGITVAIPIPIAESISFVYVYIVENSINFGNPSFFDQIIQYLDIAFIGKSNKIKILEMSIWRKHSRTPNKSGTC